MNHHWGCTLIYWPLSYTFRSLDLNTNWTGGGGGVLSPFVKLCGNFCHYLERRIIGRLQEIACISNNSFFMHGETDIQM